MSKDILKLPEQARIEFIELYNKCPRAVESLCVFPGEVGRLAQLCLACGQHQSH